MSLQYILHLKVPAAKVVLTIREGFGTHLLPVFYSGSIDLVMQNLCIVLISKLVEYGKINFILVSSKKGLLTFACVIRNEWSTLLQIIKTLNNNPQPDSSMMMLRITNQGMVQVYTSSIYQALYKISKSKRSAVRLDSKNHAAKEVA